MKIYIAFLIVFSAVTVFGADNTAVVAVCGAADKAVVFRDLLCTCVGIFPSVDTKEGCQFLYDEGQALALGNPHLDGLVAASGDVVVAVHHKLCQMENGLQFLLPQFVNPSDPGRCFIIPVENQPITDFDRYILNCVQRKKPIKITNKASWQRPVDEKTHAIINGLLSMYLNTANSDTSSGPGLHVEPKKEFPTGRFVLKLDGPAALAVPEKKKGWGCCVS